MRPTVSVINPEMSIFQLKITFHSVNEDLVLNEKKNLGWGCGSVADCLLTILKAMNSIPSMCTCTCIYKHNRCQNKMNEMIELCAKDFKEAIKN